MATTAHSHHAPAHTATFADKNAAHFNTVSEDTWPQWVLDLHQQIIDFLSAPECPEWLGIANSNNARMLDYACGNGMISKTLRPQFRQCIGVDVSWRMVELYQATAKALALGPEEMTAVRGDFTAVDEQPTEPSLPEDKLWNFDLIAISMALHHLGDPSNDLARLARHLKPGGTLFVVDWTPKDGSTRAQREYKEQVVASAVPEAPEEDHPARHTVSKPDGFTKAEMDEIFQLCGCFDFQWSLCEELTDVPPAKTKFQMFFARATKK